MLSFLRKNKNCSLLFGLYVVFHFLYVCACIFVRGKSVWVCLCVCARSCACVSVNGSTGVTKQQCVHVSGSVRGQRGLHGHRGPAARRHRAGGGQRWGQPRHAVPQGQGPQAHRRPPPRQEGREGEVRLPSGVMLRLLSGWGLGEEDDKIALDTQPMSYVHSQPAVLTAYLLLDHLYLKWMKTSAKLTE